MNTKPFLTPRTSLVRPCVTLSLLSLLVPGLASAQTAVRDNRLPADRNVRVVESPAPLKGNDRDFLEKAAKSSMSEVAISRVAAARTSNAEVRRFAQTMIEDHQDAMDELGRLASHRGVALPAKDPSPEKWEKRDAKNFDRDYLDQMIDDHEDVVKRFEKQATDGDDGDAVAYARKYLPRMQQHLQHAIDLKRALTEKRR